MHVHSLPIYIYNPLTPFLCLPHVTFKILPRWVMCFLQEGPFTDFITWFMHKMACAKYELLTGYSY